MRSYGFSRKRERRIKPKGAFAPKAPSSRRRPQLKLNNYHGNFGPRDGTKLIVFDEVSLKRGFSRLVNSNVVLSLITAGSVADFMN